jgi:hypothetical protein
MLGCPSQPADSNSQEVKMGQWTIVIQGTGCHHNFKKAENKLVPDGEGDYERSCADADHAAARFVRELKAKGHNISGATFTSGGIEDISKDRHLLKAEV